MCKTYEYTLLPVWISAYAIVCSGFWIVYAILQTLPEMLGPNVFGFTVSVVSVVFYVVYRHKYLKRKQQQEEEGAESKKALV